MSAAVSPARTSAASAARVPRCEVVSPSAAIWRCRMPVRCSIHSSEVSTRSASSAFDNTRFGQSRRRRRARQNEVSMSVMEGGVPGGAADSRRRGRGGGRPRFVGLPDHLADFSEQFLTDHVVADLDRAGEALGVRPAMTS